MLITGSPSLQLDTLREEITRLHAAGELEASMRAGLNELPEDLRLRAMEKLVTGAWAALLPP